MVHLPGGFSVGEVFFYDVLIALKHEVRLTTSLTLICLSLYLKTRSHCRMNSRSQLRCMILNSGREWGWIVTPFYENVMQDVIAL